MAVPRASAGHAPLPGPAARPPIAWPMLRRLLQRVRRRACPAARKCCGAPHRPPALTRPWLLALGGGKRTMQAPPPHLSRPALLERSTGLQVPHLADLSLRATTQCVVQ